MSKGNPIIPSEPLSLQADLIAEAVLADEADSRDNGGWDRELSPRSASKVRRRTDNRNYGRSESPRRSESYGRDDDHDTYMEHRESPQSHRHRGGRGDRSVSGHNRNGGSWNNDGAEGRSRSPGYVAPRSPDYAAPRSPSSGGRNDYRRRANDRDREPEAASNDPYMRNGNDAAKDDPTPCRVLGIFGMSKFTNESDLQEIFERFGPVEKIQLIRDPHEGHSRCFGFINMANVNDARRARDELTDSMIHDRKVRVDFSKTNRAHSPTPGKYKGQDTSQLAQQRRRDRQPDRGPRRYGDDRRNGDDRHYGGRRFGDDRRNGDDRRYGGGPGQQSSYNDSRGGAPYRRRPNSRDRRRQDHPYYGGARSRSRSPGYNASPKRGGYDSNRRSTNYGEGGGRSREYDDRRAGGYGGGGRSPQQRSHGQDRGGFGYDQRPAEGRGRSSRGDYQPRGDYQSRESPGAAY